MQFKNTRFDLSEVSLFLEQIVIDLASEPASKFKGTDRLMEGRVDGSDIRHGELEQRGAVLHILS